MEVQNPTIDKAMSQVNLSPSKGFFVNMLTRDIELDDSILDLVDNCVDGAMRNNIKKTKNDNPYKGYLVDITINGENFIIEDNCGGIPLGIAKNYAFRLGRSPDTPSDDGLATVGMYGIGMKRAIFKMGQHAIVSSKTITDSFSVIFTEEWLIDDNSWEIPMVPMIDKIEGVGTRIVISDLSSGVRHDFSGKTAFVENLTKKVGEHLGYIIEKGLRIRINDIVVKPKKISFLFDYNAKEGTGLAPYVYKGTYNDVNIELLVGLYRNLPEESELESAENGDLGSPESDIAGWTVICNDRVIYYADKTMRTGWGEAGVPKYHTQFVSIAGIVKFYTNKPEQLPVGTTKRTIEGNSEIYLITKNFMREGLKCFTNYTNKWKIDIEGEKENKQKAEVVSEKEIVKYFLEETALMKKIGDSGKRYLPRLPIPKEANKKIMIRFSKPKEEIDKVSKIVYDNYDASPSDVGAKCFEIVLRGKR